ncbi:MAG: double zinc ribbon domain-containing protein [Pseudoxanthomonas suwonensis]|nr:double zinc ribbon domain-containing protein [Pseudoxanthomonas suwonensis]
MTVNFPLPLQVDRWLDCLLPPRCLLCHGAGADGRDLCAHCHADLPWLTTACPACALPLPAVDAAERLPCGRCQRRPPPLQQTRAAFLYRTPLDRLLPRLKFHDGLAAARLLAGLMADVARDWPQPQAIVPVPLHPGRLRQRGYDQALELARPLARRLRLPLRADLLRRVRPTSAQSRLDATARRRNLRRAFAGNPTGALPAHVALVDDVMTTGATLHAAAAALHRAGVARVDAWVCARVP